MSGNNWKPYSLNLSVLVIELFRPWVCNERELHTSCLTTNLTKGFYVLP
jgi:hypothetical protein